MIAVVVIAVSFAFVYLDYLSLSMQIAGLATGLCARAWRELSSLNSLRAPPRILRALMRVSRARFDSNWFESFIVASAEVASDRGKFEAIIFNL